MYFLRLLIFNEETVSKYDSCEALGTPGAAIIVTPRTSKKGKIVPNVMDSPCKNKTAVAQLNRVIVLPDKCIFASKGIVKPAILSFTFNFLVCSNVTGIVAADDWVPSAVK